MDLEIERKKVSVVIPMYNAEKTIERTILSVVNQSYNGPVEIIIINDGSEDDSGKIVEDFIVKYKCQNIKLIHQQNGGVSKARNNGLKNSSGAFIALLDADDEWLESKLEVQMNYLKSNLSIDFLGCARNNEVLTLRNKVIDQLYKASPKDLLIRMFPQTSTAIFRRNLYDQFGGYNETMTHAEDGELWLRYCVSAGFYYLPQNLVLTGDGKPSFGYSGLSANLEKMYLGNLIILRLAKHLRVINSADYFSFRFFYFLKYLRRFIITKLR